jgi:hypothetical protein
MTAIAAEAGVALKTVYVVFATKRADCGRSGQKRRPGSRSSAGRGEGDVERLGDASRRRAGPVFPTFLTDVEPGNRSVPGVDDMQTEDVFHG